MKKNEISSMDVHTIFKTLDEMDKKLLEHIDRLSQHRGQIGDRTLLKLIKSVIAETNSNTKFIFAIYFNLKFVKQDVKILSQAIEAMIKQYGVNFDSQEIKAQLQNLKKQAEENQDVIDVFKTAFENRYFGSGM